MLVVHAFREACQSLKTHAFRTLSMGFGVFWAIFIVVCLLGIGNGFQNGVSEAFAKYGAKTMIIWQGRSANRTHPISLEIASNLSDPFSSIQYLSPILGCNSSISYQTTKILSSVLGCDPSYALLTYLPMQEGRFFTERDKLGVSNICVIGINIKEKLLGPGSAIGKYIFLEGIGLQVVGVIDRDIHLYNEPNSIWLTNGLFKTIFPNCSQYVKSIRLTLLPNASEKVAEKQFRSYFARHLHFHAEDTKAIAIFSIAKHAAEFGNFFKNIAIFNTIIGICLLITGIVAISNMMLVVIKERKQEMAIRKVLGSGSIEIVAVVLAEVFMVTFVAGIIGSTLGLSFIELLNKWVVPLCKPYYLSTLTCPVSFIFGGLGLIILASCLASILPAISAVRIKPIDALSSK